MRTGKVRNGKVRNAVLPRRALRWFVPAGILTVAGLAATGAFAASASESKGLPDTTPGALLVAMRSAPMPEGFYGTILSQASLGLPDLPSFGGTAGDIADDSSVTSFTSLLSGSHTVQVWFGGRDRQRIALLGRTDETDVFHSGRQVWTWNSSERIARHAVLPAVAAAHDDAPAASTEAPSVTPSALAQQALAALAPTTRVTARAGQQVADRDAYELTLTPRTAGTLVGSVRIAVDGQTKLPLRVQVFARGASTPAIDVSYTSIRFSTPPASAFTFTPPPGATVHSLDLGRGAMHMLRGGHDPAVSGTGWTRVVKLATGKAVDPRSDGLRQVLTPVSGSWGHGGVLRSALLTVLVTSKGTVYAGPVPADTLYAAAGAR